MQKMVRDEEITRVRTNLHYLPTLADALSSDWIENVLLTKTERMKKHAIFWLLLNVRKSKKLETWLYILKPRLEHTKFKRIKNNLKKKSGLVEFNSFIPEIEVLSYYINKSGEHFKVFYEPPQGDIKLTLDGNEVFLEIAKLFSSREESRIDSLIHTVQESINSLENNRYVVSFGISPEFQERDVAPFIKFVSKTIAKEIETLPSGEIAFDNGKAWLEIVMVSPRERGYVGAVRTGVFQLHPSGRLKKKILDEVEQLPENKPCVVIYNISQVPTEFDDIEDAFLGELVLVVNKKTMQTYSARKENGIIHHEKGARVSVLIAFKDFDYENRRLYVNPKAKFPLSDEVLAVL